MGGDIYMPIVELSLGSLINPIWQVLTAAWKKVRGRRRGLTPQDVVAMRMKWKPEFEQRIQERRRKKLRRDVIVRDVRRLDGYPHIEEGEKGISSWIRVALVGTYQAGIQLHLGWHKIVPGFLGGWRLPGPDDQDRPRLKVALIAYVPYEQIEGIDWDGDEYYGFPVLYCHFENRKDGPYERLAFSECRVIEHPSGDYEYYSDIADATEVIRASKKLGIAF
jgi:hypothetical protein